MARTQVRKVVLPVAGLGTRLRPLTARLPKALVEVAGRPMVDYALEEAERSGFSEVVLVVSAWCRGHFAEYLRTRRSGRRLAVRVAVQRQPLGTGHAVLQAAPHVRGEPFVVRYADDVLCKERPALAALAELYNACRAPLLTVKRVPMRDAHRYGVADVRKLPHGTVHEVVGIVERPWDRVEHPPSNLAVVGAYVLTPRLMDHLRNASFVIPPIKDALPINIAFREEIRRGGRVYGWEFRGQRFDCGVLDGICKAEKFFGRAS